MTMNFIKISKEQNENPKRLMVSTFMTFLAFSFNLDAPIFDDVTMKYKFMIPIYNIIGSFHLTTILSVVLFFGIVLLYRYINNTILDYNKKRDVKKIEYEIVIPSIMFAVFIVFGYSFAKENSYNMLLGIRNGQIVKTLIVICGYYIFFEKLLKCLYYKLDKYVNDKDKECVKEKDRGFLLWYTEKLEKSPFLTMFVTLLIPCIINFIISYPAVFMGDTYSHIVQAFSELKNTGSDYLDENNILSNSVYINLHHCVAYTLLIHVCLLVGDYFFNSFNTGIFICSVMQSLGMIVVLSYAFNTVKKRTTITSYQSAFIILYCMIHPQINNYMCLMAKDVLYTEFFALLVIALYNILRDVLDGKRARKRELLFLGTACLGMLLFRNEARIMLPIIFFVILVFFKNLRKICVGIICFVFIVSYLLWGLMFPILKYTPGSKGEMFSVPFQQTARYISLYDAEVTQEEKDAINGVLDYDIIKEQYNPVLSNPVKATYKIDSTSDDLKRYFKVWVKMFFKHPGSYIAATANNYYQFFTPDGVCIYRYSYQWSEWCMNYTNDEIAALDKHFSYPNKTNACRSIVDELNARVVVFPPIALIMTPALYTWLLLIMFFYALREKSKYAVALILPTVMILLVCITGPENGYYGRYSFPLVVVMPFLGFMFLDIIRKEKLRGDN